MTDLHASERARLFRETVSTERRDDELHGQPVSRLVSTIPPGSIEETDALAAIDQARAEEMNPPSRRKRVRRHRAHWSDRDHAIRGF